MVIIINNVASSHYRGARGAQRHEPRGLQDPAAVAAAPGAHH